MFSRLKRWLSSSKPTNNPGITQDRREPQEAAVLPPDAPLPLEVQLAIANGRIREDAARQAVAWGIQQHRRRLREASDNPGSLFAASIVDPYSWADDTPDFYPGIGGMGGFGVPWMLNNQGRGDVLPVYINEYGLKLIRDWSRKILAFNEFAINAVENRVSYIVGKGFQYSVLPKKKPKKTEQPVGAESGTEPGGLATAAQSILDEFISRERWNEREQESVRRCDRDGEAIIRFFHVGGGRTAVRFVEPECLTDQSGQQHRFYGVNTNPHDIEDVETYSIVSTPSASWTTEDVPADRVLHIKLNTDFDCKRGLPTLFAVRKNLERADKLLRNMSVMAQVQATFAVLRKHKQFSPSSVSAYQQAQGDLSYVNPASGRNTQMQQLMAGSIIDTSDKTQYEFPAAGVNSAGLVAVLQAELRAVAARLVMPEFMLTVDASNANYASTMVAEAPSVKNFERLQHWFGRRFGDGEYGRPDVGGGRLVGAMWRVLDIAVEGGLLPPETLTDLEIQVEGPTLVVRDKTAETMRAKTLADAGILSDDTWSKWEGLDREQEMAQGAKKQAPPQMPGGGPPPGGEPKPTPPGSAGGDEGMDLFSEEIKHVFGKCIDTGTHKTVACPASGADRKGGNFASPQPGDKAKREQLAADVKAMEATPEGNATLAKGAKLGERVKASIKSAVEKALSAVDAESGGGISLMVGGHPIQGASQLIGVVFQCVHEEVFEAALSQHSIPGAHAVGMVAATVAAKAEGGLLKAVAWTWGKMREEVEMFEAAGELTDADKELVSHLARIAGNAVAAVYKEAGVSDVQVDADAAAQRILSSLRGGRDVEEEIKHVFGKCIDTDTHKQVPCPQKTDGSGGEKPFKKEAAKKGAMGAARREGKGKDAKIVLDDGSPAPAHIKASMVPPQWTDVRVSLDPDAEVLVQARDKAGRGKTVYSDAFHMRNAALKFSRVREGLQKREEMSSENQKNRENLKLRDNADCVWLMMEQATRPGSDSDTKAKVKAYGATTLRAEHVEEKEDGVYLHFIGKEGVEHNHKIRNPQLAEMLVERKKTADKRDGKLFDTNYNSVTDYAKTLDGGLFTPKDFRTIRATSMAVDLVKSDAERPKSMKEYKERVKAVAEKVSGVLGNRPQQALESYIDPTVFTQWQVPNG